MVIINKDVIKKMRSSQRKGLIINLSGRKLNGYESTLLNDLVLYESKSILKRKSKKCNVLKGKVDRRRFRLGECYSNSVQMMKNGYGYVEGYVITKDGDFISHAWNIDTEGHCWDFTFKDPENYEYFGLEIPEDVLWEVGRKNGHIWFSVLPFVDEKFNLKNY